MHFACFRFDYVKAQKAQVFHMWDYSMYLHAVHFLCMCHTYTLYA